MPTHCHRESQRAFLLSLLPALGVISAFFGGYANIAAWIFGTTFALISIGTIIPRCSLFGPLVSRLPAGTQSVCLTIDDGPDPHTTPALLDLLDAHQAQALFFLIGDRAAQHPELVREIITRGHAVGNHTQSHPAGSFWMLRPWALWREVAACQQTLCGLLGAPPVWFRPPVGHHNFFLTIILRTLGLRMMIWNCRGFDGVQREVSTILKSLSRGLRPGAIILLHEGRTNSADVLRGTLEMIQARGLQTAPISHAVRTADL
jgi:peptidoglycan-N-acetylglucosamine deacetylase